MKFKPCLFLLLFAVGKSLFAGGGPQNVLVVVNDESADSQELGHYYCEKRGIPERNICHIRMDPDSETLSLPDFEEQMLVPIQKHISEQGLQSQIDYIALCHDFPTRVYDNEGITTVLFYGYKEAPTCPPCGTAPNTRNPYYYAERYFQHDRVMAGRNCYLSFLLTAKNMDQAKALVDRSVASDFTRPTGSFYLVQNRSDANRSIRYRLFENWENHMRQLTTGPKGVLVVDWSLAKKSDILGYMEGSSFFGKDNVFLAGSLGDHMTSFGGRIPKAPMEQDDVLDWIEAGVSATYGTVNEPCAILQKFPDPMVFFWYARGFNAAESYYMSVANPYQGIFLGDPLTAPFAIPPKITMENFERDQIISGKTSVTVRAGSESSRCRSLEVYIDDLFASSVTNIVPASGSRIDVRIGTSICSYVSISGESLNDVLKGLAYSINSRNLQVEAQVHGDRLMLLWNPATPAEMPMTYSVAVHGSTLSATAAGAEFVYGPWAAREFISVGGTANEGDTVTCIITKLDGTRVTNQVVATKHQTGHVVMQELMGLINSNDALQDLNGVTAGNYKGGTRENQPVGEATLDARMTGPGGARLTVDIRVTQSLPGSGLMTNLNFADHFNDNQALLSARGCIYFECGMAPIEAEYKLDTRILPDGLHTLRFVSTDGSAVQAQGHGLLPIRIKNTEISCSLEGIADGQEIDLGKKIALSIKTENVSGAIKQASFQIEGKTYRAGNDLECRWETRDHGPGRITLRAQVETESGAQCISDPVQVRIVR